MATILCCLHGACAKLHTSLLALSAQCTPGPINAHIRVPTVANDMREQWRPMGGQEVLQFHHQGDFFLQKYHFTMVIKKVAFVELSWELYYTWQSK